MLNPSAEESNIQYTIGCRCVAHLKHFDAHTFGYQENEPAGYCEEIALLHDCLHVPYVVIEGLLSENIIP
jgi:hypothetical protein